MPVGSGIIYISSDEREEPTTKNTLHPAKPSFRVNREIKRFTDKQKLTEFSTAKPVLQQMLKGLL